MDCLEAYIISLVTDDDGRGAGGRKRDVRRTSRMKAQHSSHTDTAGSKDRDSLRSTRNTGSRNSQPETQTLFLQIRQHQNVAPERKRFPLPRVQLREVFSKSLLFTSTD